MCVHAYWYIYIYIYRDLCMHRYNNTIYLYLVLFMYIYWINTSWFTRPYVPLHLLFPFVFGLALPDKQWDWTCARARWGASERERRRSPISWPTSEDFACVQTNERFGELTSCIPTWLHKEKYTYTLILTNYSYIYYWVPCLILIFPILIFIHPL